MNSIMIVQFEIGKSVLGQQSIASIAYHIEPHNLHSIIRVHRRAQLYLKLFKSQCLSMNIFTPRTPLISL